MTQASLFKAFTQDAAKGNPAAVICDDLAESDFPRIAGLLGLPATAFLQPVSANECSVRFFSPTSESGLCVHALLAASQHLIPDRPKRSYRFKTSNAEVEVTRAADGALMVALPDPVVGTMLEDVAPVAAALNVDPVLFADEPIQVFSRGKAKLLIPFKSQGGLRSMSPDLALVRALCLSNAAEGIFAFTTDTLDPVADYYARHFNPLTLLEEDPICGVGSGALSGYLQHHGLLRKPNFRVEMGYTSDLPGMVYVETSPMTRVGGFAIQFGEQSV